jgi:hypothetical protein
MFHDINDNVYMILLLDNPHVMVEGVLPWRLQKSEGTWKELNIARFEVLTAVLLKLKASGILYLVDW